MYEAYPVFTVIAGVVTPGAVIEKQFLQGAQVEIPAIVVGEGHRKRLVPIHLVEEQQKLVAGTFPTLMAAALSQTRAQAPKFIQRLVPTHFEKAIVVFRTPVGTKGKNQHTGDRIGWKCRSVGCLAHGDERISPETCPACGKNTSRIFGVFPGTVLMTGVARTSVSYAEQLVAVLEKDQVCRTFYCAEINGSFSHYLMWNGAQLLSATWEERNNDLLF